MQYYRLEQLINLHEGYCRRFQIDQHQLLLLERDGERLLIEGRCPHRGHLFSADDIGEQQLRCPLHGYCFDVYSGALIKATEEPCRGLVSYELIYRDKEVGVML